MFDDLPDIPQDAWNEFSSNQFVQNATAQIQSLGQPPPPAPEQPAVQQAYAPTASQDSGQDWTTGLNNPQASSVPPASPPPTPEAAPAVQPAASASVAGGAPAQGADDAWYSGLSNEVGQVPQQAQQAASAVGQQANDWITGLNNEVGTPQRQQPQQPDVQIAPEVQVPPLPSQRQPSAIPQANQFGPQQAQPSAYPSQPGAPLQSGQDPFKTPINSAPTLSRDQTIQAAQTIGLPADEAGYLYDRGVQAGIDPGAALAIIKLEGNVKTLNNNMFDIQGGDGVTPVPAGDDPRWGAYKNHQASIDAFYDLINNHYVGHGQDTIGEVMHGPGSTMQTTTSHAYAPIFENDPLYPQKVVDLVAGWGKLPGGAPAGAQPAAPVAQVQAPAITDRMLDPSRYGYGDATPRNGLPVKFIVNHVADAEGSLYDAYQRQDENTHYWVGKDGSIEHYVPDDQASYGAGTIGAHNTAPPDFPGNGQDYNRESINIEREGRPGELPTAAQWKSLVQLNAYLAQKYNVPVDNDHIVGHYRTDADTRAMDPYVNPQQYMDNLISGVQDATPKQANAAQQASNAVLDQVNNVVTQVGGRQGAAPVQAQREFERQAGLSDAQAYSACGPVAAVAFAQTYGRNPSPQEAIQLARGVGWNPGTGMAGVDSEAKLLSQMGVDVHVNYAGPQGLDWSAVQQDANTGNPVILDTPFHYWYVDGYNQANGAYHVGNSGLAMSGGSEWMTPDEMARFGRGPVRAAVFADHPNSPSPSVATQIANQAGTTYNDVFQGAGDVWQGAQQTAGNITSSVGTTAQNAVGGLIGTAQTAAGGVGQTFDTFGSTANAAAQGASDLVTRGQQQVEQAFAPVQQGLDTFGSSARQAQQQAFDTFGTTAGQAASGIGSTFGQAQQAATQAPQSALDAVKQKFSDALDAFGSLMGGQQATAPAPGGGYTVPTSVQQAQALQTFGTPAVQGAGPPDVDLGRALTSTAQAGAQAALGALGQYGRAEQWLASPDAQAALALAGPGGQAIIAARPAVQGFEQNVDLPLTQAINQSGLVQGANQLLGDPNGYATLGQRQRLMDIAQRLDSDPASVTPEERQFARSYGDWAIQQAAMLAAGEAGGVPARALLRGAELAPFGTSLAGRLATAGARGAIEGAITGVPTGIAQAAAPGLIDPSVRDDPEFLQKIAQSGLEMGVGGAALGGGLGLGGAALGEGVGALGRAGSRALDILGRPGEGRLPGAISPELTMVSLTPEEAARLTSGATMPAGVTQPSRLTPAEAVDMVQAGDQPPRRKGRVMPNDISGPIRSMLDQAAAQPVTAAERNNVAPLLQKYTEANGRVIGAPSHATTLDGLALLYRRLNALADHGAAQRFWYTNSSRAIMDATQGDRVQAEKLAQLAAIYSQQTAVSENMNRALTAWYQHQNGQPIWAGLPGQDKRAADLLYNGVQWEGRKTNNFYRNLMAVIDPQKFVEMGLGGKSGVTADIWIMRALGYPATNAVERKFLKAPSNQQYNFIQDLISQLAADKGWDPEQAQAAIWSSAKAGWEGKTVGKAGYDFANSLADRAGQTSWEASPGTEALQHIPGYDAAPWDEQAQFHQATKDALLDGDGNDILAKVFGLLRGNTLDSAGVYDEGVHPGGQEQVYLPMARQSRPSTPEEIRTGVSADGPVTSTIDKDTGKTEWRTEISANVGKVSQDARDAINAYAAARGYLLKQDAVPWTRLFKSGTQRDANAVAVDLGNTISPEQADAVNQGLRQILGPDQHALVASPDGVWALNLDDQRMSNKTFGDALQHVLEVTDSIPAYRAQPMRYDSEYISNDWSQNPNGEGYLDAIRRAGRGEAFGEVADSLAQRVRDAQTRTAKDLGWEGWDTAPTPGPTQAFAYPGNRSDLDLRPGLARWGQPATDLDLGIRPVTQAELADLTRGASMPAGVTSGHFLTPEEAFSAADRLGNGHIASPVEEALDRPEDIATARGGNGIVLPGEPRGNRGPTQIYGPSGNLLSTVANDIRRTGRGLKSPEEMISSIVRGRDVPINSPSAATGQRMPNLDYLATDDPDMQRSIQRIVEDNPALFDRYQQGRITHQQLIHDLAPRVGMTDQQFLNSPVGKAFNPQELLALRSAAVKSQGNLDNIVDDIIQRGGDTGKLSDSEMLQARMAMADASKMQAVAAGGGSTAGRTLNQQRIAVTRALADIVRAPQAQRQAEARATVATARASRAEKLLDDVQRTEHERDQAATRAAKAPPNQRTIWDKINAAYDELNQYKGMSLEQKEEDFQRLDQQRRQRESARQDVRDDPQKLLDALNTELAGERKLFAGQRGKFVDMAARAQQVAETTVPGASRQGRGQPGVYNETPTSKRLRDMAAEGLKVEADAARGRLNDLRERWQRDPTSVTQAQLDEAQRAASRAEDAMRRGPAGTPTQRQQRGAQQSGTQAWLKAQADAARRDAVSAGREAERAWNTELGNRDLLEKASRKALERIGGRDVSDAMLKQYIEIRKSGDPMMAAKFLQGLHNQSWWGRLQTLRYAGMLSSTITHLAQATGNAINTGLDIPVHALASTYDIGRYGIGRALGQDVQRQRYLSEIPDMVRGMSEGAQASLPDIMATLKYGINPAQLSRNLEDVHPGFGAEQLFPNHPTAAARLNAVAEGPLRAMEAGDIFFRRASQGGWTRALARRTALQEGLQGSAADARVGDIMQNLHEYPELVAEAENRGRRAVMQEQPFLPRPQGDALGSAVASQVLPFWRTTMNQFAQGLGLTPAGALSALRGGLTAGDREDRLARATIGTILGAISEEMARNGYITGDTPSDPSERSTLPPGWQPYSLRTPDGHYISMSQLGPVAVPLSIGATIGDMRRDPNLWQSAHGDAGVLASKFLGGMAHYGLNQTMLQDLSQIYQGLSNPNGPDLGKVLGTMAGSYVPYGALQRQIMRSQGMAARDPKSFGDYIAQNVLGLAGAVPEKLDPLGRPQVSAESGIGSFISPAKWDADRDSPVLQAMRSGGVGIPAVPKDAAYKNGKVAFTDDEQRHLQQLRGQLLEQRVARAMAHGDFADKPTPAKNRILSRLASQATADARMQMIRSIPKAEADQRWTRDQPEPFLVEPGETLPDTAYQPVRYMGPTVDVNQMDDYRQRVLEDMLQRQGAA